MSSFPFAAARAPFALFLTVCGLGLVAFGAVAQEAPAPASAIDPNAVVATVGGEPITEADLGFVVEEVGAQNIGSIPPDQVRAMLLTEMIDTKLMAQAARAKGLDKEPLFVRRVDYLATRALRSAHVATVVAPKVTPEAIKAEYDTQVATLPQEEEVHARHILLSSADDAKAVKAELDGGGDFAELAKTKSIEPNAAQSGGDLGYFKASAMVKPFADAAFAMKVGEISAPVESQFGWHIIKLEDRRMSERPTLEQMTPQIGQKLYVDAYRAEFLALRGTATIDIPDAALKTAVDAALNAAQ